MAPHAALQVDGLSKVFGGSRRVPAVEDVSFAVQPGEIVGLLGPNGAGKTTIIKCVLGLVRPSSGYALVFGHDVQRNPKAVLARAAAVLEGSRNTYWHLTAWENAVFFSGLHGLWAGERSHRGYLDMLFDRFGLTSLRDTVVRELSTGYKQKVAVVAALARRTPLVFLDEPTLGLDVQTSLELRALLSQMSAEEDRAVVLSSHDMDVVQDTCQRVIILSSGRVVVDDQVDRLLSLFRARRYRLEISGSVPANARQAISALDDSSAWSVGDGVAHLEIGLQSAEQLYELVEVFRRHGLLIETIVQREPDLEQAFLSLMRRVGQA